MAGLAYQRDDPLEFMQGYRKEQSVAWVYGNWFQS